MARTAIAVSTIKQAKDGPFGNSDLEITEAACSGSTGANGNKALAGKKKTRFRFRNTGASGRVVTITSVADPATGRTGDITATIGAGKIWEVDVPSRGFRQSSGADKGYIYFEAAHAEVVCAVNHLS